jgi:hypothetical protein
MLAASPDAAAAAAAAVEDADVEGLVPLFRWTAVADPGGSVAKLATLPPSGLCQSEALPHRRCHHYPPRPVHDAVGREAIAAGIIDVSPRREHPFNSTTYTTPYIIIVTLQ